MPDFALILPAAGSSTRFGKNKLTESLDGVPVIVRSLRAFLALPIVREIVIPTSDGAELSAFLESHNTRDARIRLCAGGTSRADSVRRAALEVSKQIDWIAVHDAARPLVSAALIARTLDAAVEHHSAAVPALPVHLTIKQATGPLPAKVARTLPRHELWAMQTPQVMRRADLLDAFARCPIPLEQVTDDVQLIEMIGKEVWLVPGEESNLKITTPLDLEIASTILRSVPLSS